MEESSKAQEKQNGEAYAGRTARNAAAAVESERSLPRARALGRPEQG